MIGRLLARRLSLGVVTLGLASVVVFVATQLLPGDAARAVLGRDASPARLAAFRHEYGLDASPFAQYWHWLSGLLTGDPGVSLASHTGVWPQTEPHVANSLYLLGAVALLGIPLSLAFGAWSAVRRDRVPDTVVSTLALVLAALPEFVVAIGLILLLATGAAHVLPPVSLVPPGSSVWENPKVLVLPTLTLTIAIFPYVYRMFRSSLVSVLESEFIEMACLKGVGSLRLLIVHAAPNALAPVVQAIGLTLAYLAGGVVVVEYVFGYPGVGQQFVGAVNSRDLPVIQLIASLLAAFYIVTNIAADVVVILTTPRLRRRSRA